MDGLAIAACLRELRESLLSGVIQKIHQPTRDLVVLQVRAAGTQRVLIEPKAAGLHRTNVELESPQTPFAFVMLLRRYLRGGRITAIRQRGRDRLVTFEVARRAEGTTLRYELVCELVGVRGNVLLVQGGRVLGSMRPSGKNRIGGPYHALVPQAKDDPETVSVSWATAAAADEDVVRRLARTVDGVGRRTAEDIVASAGGVAEVTFADRLRARLDDVLRCVESPDATYVVTENRATFYPLPPPAEPTQTFGEALDRAFHVRLEEQRDRSEEDALVVPLQRALAKTRRTQEKLRDWLDQASAADALQASADLLMIHQRDIERGVDHAEVVDPTTEQVVHLRLDPSLTAIENAQRMYERAKRLRRGAPHVQARLARLEREAAELSEGVERARRGEPVDERALAHLPTPRKPPKGRTQPAGPRRYTIEGFTVLVGRSAKENDRLLRAAAPNDLWLHVHEAAGSHVIVRRGGSREVPQTVVVEAARLAARHSKRGGERRAEVVVTEVKHVRKPKGAPDGLAIVRNQDTLTVDLGPVEKNE